MRVIDECRVTIGSKISPRIWQDSCGCLICRDAVIARTGAYDYLESEIIDGGDPNKVIKVFRTEDEVFNPTAIASFEDKCLCLNHPESDISAETYKDLSKGYMRNVRRGKGELSNCLICDLVITDPETIELVKNGELRELSLGYNTIITDNGDGQYVQRAIRGNHIALVESGRAGCATIRDSATVKKWRENMLKKQKVTLFDDDIYEVEEVSENPVAEESLPEVDAPKGEAGSEPTLSEIHGLLKQILEILQKPAASAPAETVDADVEVEEITENLPEKTAGEPVAEEETDAENPDEALLDADKLLVGKEGTARDAKAVYGKFASIGDTRKVVLAKEVNDAWSARYAKMAGK